ncbi:glycosyltransferase family 4 protein [Georgenia daeguensis]|uniref:Glycosyltransferase family 4 protein n=1 Tax=Georgenia daeguensis TaxID=908355 RepID=A0ABP6UP27_9MICO
MAREGGTTAEPAAAAGQLGFVTWDRTAPSGGNTYDCELVAALRAAGNDVVVHALSGAWPEPAGPDLDRLAAALAAHPVSLVDGIVASGAPGPVEEAVAEGCRVVVLVHMAAADEVGLAAPDADRREKAEGRALRAASAVVATSRTAADDLAARHGLRDVRVARPGARRAPTAGGSTPPRILAVANLTPTKDPLTLVRALHEVTDLPWTAVLVGSPDVDRDFAEAVRREAAGLGERVRLAGALVGDPLEAEWSAADLLVLTSRTETFGMVVLEALAHGVPAVVGAGTGAVEALTRGALPGQTATPGAAVPPGDPGALAAMLRRWLTDTSLRDQWRRAAADRRATLPGWDVTAAIVGQTLP